MSQLPSHLYKYVPAKDAHFLESGSIRIGTLRTFAVLENGRADDREGEVGFRPPNVTIRSGVDTPERRALAGIGIRGPGAISLHGAPGSILISNAVQDVYCLCLSLDPDNAHLQAHEEQAIFEIYQPLEFLNYVDYKFGRGQMRCGFVHYDNREFDLMERGDAKPSAFIKRQVRLDTGYSFESEREFRVVWEPPSPAPIEPVILTGLNCLPAFWRRIK